MVAPATQRDGTVQEDRWVSSLDPRRLRPVQSRPMAEASRLALFRVAVGRALAGCGRRPTRAPQEWRRNRPREVHRAVDRCPVPRRRPSRSPRADLYRASCLISGWPCRARASCPAPFTIQQSVCKRPDTGNEFRVGRLFTGVGSWRACFAAALGPVVVARMTGAGKAAEFATRSTARGARTIMARKCGTGVPLMVALWFYFLNIVGPFAEVARVGLPG